MIKIEHVSKSYKDKLVLRDVSVTVEDNEFIVIIGSSGCGKTTLLKLINKLLPMDRGNIIINGHSIRDVQGTELRRKIGYVLQDGGLFPHLTVKENLELVLKIGDMPAEKRVDRVFELLDMVNMDPKVYCNSYPCQLSGGQRQRVGVARAFALDPDLILMDEPFSALDPLTREELQDEIVKLQKEYKKTVIFVTHDMDEAIKCADKICVIEEGRVAQFDQPEEILKHLADDYVEKFVGRNRLWGNPSYIHASDIMSTKPVQLSKDRTALQALQTMRKNGINSVLVTAAGPRKILEGVVWLEDLQKLDDRKMALRLSEVLSVDYRFVFEDTTLQEIIDRIDYDRSGIIPVLNRRGELKGFLTKSILLSALSKRYRHEEEEL